MTWIPQKDSSLESILIERLKGVASYINSYNFKDDEIGLGSGKAGAALFFFYYHRYTQEEKYLDKAYTLIDEILDFSNITPKTYSLCNGLSGIYWLIHHLYNNKFISEQPNEIIGDIEDVLFDNATKDFESGFYDYLHGPLGVSLALLENNSNVTQKHIKLSVEHLDRISKRNSENLVFWTDESPLWYEKPSLLENGKFINIHLAHGMASITMILAKIYSKTGDQLCKKLIESAEDFILKQKRDFNKTGSFFPLAIHALSGPDAHSRLAWCYGDVGIGIGMQQISTILNNNTYKIQASNILLTTGQRRDLQNNGIADAGFCHGTIGLAHIYQRMYSYTMDKKFEEIANFWYKTTLDFSVTKNGENYFKAIDSITEKEDCISLIDGNIGIGLSLISAVSDIDPKWDSLFLLS